MSRCRKCDACEKIIVSTFTPVIVFTISFKGEERDGDGSDSDPISVESGDVCSKTCAKIVLDRALDRINKARI